MELLVMYINFLYKLLFSTHVDILKLLTCIIDINYDKILSKPNLIKFFLYLSVTINNDKNQKFIIIIMSTSEYFIHSDQTYLIIIILPYPTPNAYIKKKTTQDAQFRLFYLRAVKTFERKVTFSLV